MSCANGPPTTTTAASREEARAWALAIGADRDPGVLAGDEQAMLHLIGLAMGGGGVYAEERKGRKKRKREELPDVYPAPCRVQAFLTPSECDAAGRRDCESDFMCRPVVGGWGWEFCLECLSGATDDVAGVDADGDRS